MGCCYCCITLKDSILCTVSVYERMSGSGSLLVWITLCVTFLKMLSCVLTLSQMFPSLFQHREIFHFIQDKDITTSLLVTVTSGKNIWWYVTEWGRKPANVTKRYMNKILMCYLVPWTLLPLSHRDRILLAVLVSGHRQQQLPWSHASYVFRFVLRHLVVEKTYCAEEKALYIFHTSS